MLNGKTVLITGGTGSFGKRFIDRAIANYPDIKKMIIYSRDELKQSKLKLKFPEKSFRQMRFFIGDVRDPDRLKRACEGVDVIIHAAALKQVDTAEYNPTEYIRTNINGAENIIHSALECGVKDIIALSTDKACAPINLYGATKLVSDKLFIAANNIRGSKLSKFSVVRYGNVMGSRGSVVPFFLEKKKEGTFPVTHEQMTRFNISLDEGIDMVNYALENHLGGEIFIPKIPSYRISDIAKAIDPSCKISVVGIRPGEKLHEEMIAEADSINTIEFGRYYAILPTVSFKYTHTDYLKHHKGSKVPLGFKYNSGTNQDWETVSSLQEKIKMHVDPEFRSPLD